MKIPFTKMSGAGNDFIVVDNRNEIVKELREFSISSCHRKYGIGADGMLFIEKSEIADFKMHYFNSDGSDGGMCGNGGRCIAKFAFDNSIVNKSEFTFDALGYIYGALQNELNVYSLRMKNPKDLKLGDELEIDDLHIKYNFADTGSPHCVIFLKENEYLGDIESVNIFELGRKIRQHEIFLPKGTNVNFIALKSDNSIKIRTYERGVEEETLACGTGSIASAIISAIKFKLKIPIHVEVQSGETLSVNFKNSGDEIENVTLTGPAKTIYTGEIDIE